MKFLKKFDELNILKEEVEELIPEGIPEEDEKVVVPELMGSGENMWSTEEKIDNIKTTIVNLSEEVLEDVVNYLRDTLTEMEQQSIITEDETDAIDDKHETIGEEWVIDVIELEELLEDTLDGVLQIMDGSEVPERAFRDDEYSEDDEDDDESLDYGDDDLDVVNGLSNFDNFQG